MRIAKDNLRRALVRKFGFEEVAGSKHEAVALVVNGRKVATTRFSRGLRSEDLGPVILGRIAEQIRLEPGSLSTLRGMVECTVSREAYLGDLERRGYLI